MLISELKTRFAEIRRYLSGGDETELTKWFAEFTQSIINPEVLAVGDTVSYVGRQARPEDDDDSYLHTPDFWEVDQTHIITEAAPRENGSFNYATNHGAWFQREQFELIARPTPESYEVVFAALDPDYDEEDDDGSDEESL